MADQVRDPARPGADREGELLEEIEAAIAPPRSHARFPLFDSLRGLAAISILFVHVSDLHRRIQRHLARPTVSHLDIGVPFFFLLSAFLLYRPFVAARVRAERPTRLGGYARRRFLRIAPAYWAVLTIAAIVPGMAGSSAATGGSITGYSRTTPSTPRRGFAPSTFTAARSHRVEPQHRGLLLRPAPLLRAADGLARKASPRLLDRAGTDRGRRPLLVSFLIQSRIPQSDSIRSSSTRRSGGAGGSHSASGSRRSRYGSASVPVYRA